MARATAYLSRLGPLSPLAVVWLWTACGVSSPGAGCGGSFMNAAGSAVSSQKAGHARTTGGSGAPGTAGTPGAAPTDPAGGGASAAGGPKHGSPALAAARAPRPGGAMRDPGVSTDPDLAASGSVSGSAAGAARGPAGSGHAVPRSVTTTSEGGSSARTAAAPGSSSGAPGGGSTSGSSGDSNGTYGSRAPSTSGACLPVPPPLHHINIAPHGGNGNRAQLDSTPIVCDADYCHLVMNDPARGCCPLRPEGDPMRVVCERQALGAAGPRWSFSGNGSVEAADNPFLAFAYGTGTAWACSSRSPRVCGGMNIVNGKATGKASGKTNGGAPAGGSSGGYAGGGAGTGAGTGTGPGLTLPTNCTPAPPPLSKINLKVHGGNGHRTLVDSTPIVCDLSYCSVVMNDPTRGCCPLRPEGDPMRGNCERAALGADAPRWEFSGSGGVEATDQNGFLAYAYGVGTVKACSSKAPVVCGSLQVRNK